MDQPTGAFDHRYLAFLETITNLRPSLHRYCSRMTGSVLDGEDIVQEALFQAYRKLESYDEARPLSPWIFRIAHNRCIDFLRRRGVRMEAEAEVAVPDVVVPVQADVPALARAVEHIVLALPPMERASVLLKDVFDYTLDDIAELVDSTPGGVKSALNRARSKLAASREQPVARPRASEETSRLLDLYVDRFNRRDWDGLRELTASDARLLVADRFSGRIADSPYFSRYARLAEPWRVGVGAVDGEAAVLISFSDAGVWVPRVAVRVEFVGELLKSVSDYGHCPWVLQAAGDVSLAEREA